MPDITRNHWERLFPTSLGSGVYEAEYTGGVGSGANRCLVVAFLGQSGRTVSNIYWNTTEALSLVAGPIDGPDRPIWMYYRLNPTAGVQDVRFEFSADHDFLGAYALDLENVRQSAQPDHVATNNSTGAASLAASLVTVADRSWVVAFAREISSVTVTWTNVTELATGSSMHFADSAAVVTPAGAETITGATGTADMTALIAASFAPADAPAAGGDVSWLPQVTVTNGPAFITVPAGQIPPGS